MEPLSWTGILAPLVTALWIAAAAAAALAALRFAAGFVLAPAEGQANADGTLTASRGPLEWLEQAAFLALSAVAGVVLIFVLGGAALGLEAGLIGGIFRRLIPV